MHSSRKVELVIVVVVVVTAELEFLAGGERQRF